MHLMWVMQAHHIDTEYYGRFFGPGAYGPAHAAHMATWHLRGRRRSEFLGGHESTASAN
jgi:hypothetical protein